MKQKIYKIAIYSLLFVVILASVIILPDLTMYQERYKLRSQKLPDNYKNYTVLVKLQDDTQVLINKQGEIIKKLPGDFIESKFNKEDRKSRILMSDKKSFNEYGEELKYDSRDYW